MPPHETGITRHLFLGRSLAPALLGGPQLISMMPKMVNGISEQVLQAHRRLEARVPTGRIVHCQRPVSGSHSIEPCENGPMHLVELTDHCRPAEQASSGARADRIDSIEERSREVEGPSEDPGAHCRQVAEEEEDAGERPDEDEPEEDVKEELTICPTGVLARLGPLCSEIEVTVA